MFHIHVVVLVRVLFCVSFAVVALIICGVAVRPFWLEQACICIPLFFPQCVKLVFLLMLLCKLGHTESSSTATSRFDGIFFFVNSESAYYYIGACHFRTTTYENMSRVRLYIQNGTLFYVTVSKLITQINDGIF